MTNTIITIGAIAGAVAAVIAVLAVPIKKLNIFFIWLDKFRRDWEGEEAEPGRDRVPGVMERLNRLDGELSNNGGSSLKDAVQRIEKKINSIERKLGQ
jgi:hypothetical protein